MEVGRYCITIVSGYIMVDSEWYEKRKSVQVFSVLNDQ